MLMTSGNEIVRSGKKPKLRIMFVATTPFSVNAFLAPHIEALSEYFEIILCVNLNLYDLSSHLRDIVDVVDIGFERRISPMRDLSTLFRLFSVVRRVRPVAIHSITPKAGLLAMLAGFMVRVPNRWHTFTGQVWVTKRFLFRQLLKFMDRLIVFFSTQVFADSASQCQFLRTEKIVPANRISVLGHGSIAGVDVGRFRPDELVRQKLRKELGFRDEDCVFVFVGRLVRDKGVFDLLAAYSEVVKKTSNIGLWMVGPDEEGLLPELQRASRGYETSIRWVGATSTPERYMAAADVLVLPSYREGFGSVIIEAGACGLPVVAYRIDGVIDAVDDGLSGLLVDCGHIEILANQLLALAGGADKRRMLGKNALERVHECFRADVITGAWLDHYLSSLKGLVSDA